jgi:hypothetical protein
MLDPALAADDADPDRGLASDPAGQGFQQPVHGVLAGLGLPPGVRNEHVPRGEEGQDPPDLHVSPQAAQGADVGLVERGVGTEPGHQDLQRLSRFPYRL